MTKLGKQLNGFVTNDYQNRKGNYPISNVPDSISFGDSKENKHMSLTMDFKNTTEKKAENFLRSFLAEKGITEPFECEVMQDGDYKDDWVIVTATFKR